MNTIDEIVADMLTKLSDEDKVYFSRQPSFYNSTLLGRYIRNTYNLWTTSPLTEKWREGGTNIVNGIDYSYLHPDNVSSVIMQKLIEQLKEELK